MFGAEIDSAAKSSFERYTMLWIRKLKQNKLFDTLGVPEDTYVSGHPGAGENILTQEELISFHSVLCYHIP